ncbi:hypothetical protein RKLH11_1103 [Rhodobacteraceae bacterium KLH11]|nr:hypothetical protein RKLH11_1103 [Rhodobacteraceae bacterium KLH11]
MTFKTGKYARKADRLDTTSDCKTFISRLRNMPDEITGHRNPDD